MFVQSWNSAIIQWLKAEISKKVSSNNARIAHLESLKSEDYGVDASNEKDMTATMDKIIQLVNKYVIFQNLFVFVGFCFIHFIVLYFVVIHIALLIDVELAVVVVAVIAVVVCVVSTNR